MTRIRRRSTGLHSILYAEPKRGYGFRVWCACGWEGIVERLHPNWRKT